MTSHKGFDCAQPLTGLVDGIPDDIDFVCRYLSPHAKGLTPAEVAEIVGGDLLIVSVYEGDGRTFSHDQGLFDAATAYAQARRLGQPEDTPIYFAVDCDPILPGVDNNIVPYFTAIGGVLGQHYSVGAYASGLVLGRLLGAGLISRLWLAGAMGWQGSRGFTGWHLRQQIVNGDPLGIGIPVDLDESSGEEYGGWSLAA